MNYLNNLGKLVKNSKRDVKASFTEPSEAEKNVFASQLGLQGLQLLKKALNTGISILRSMIISYSKKQLENNLTKKRILSDINIIDTISNKASNSSNVLDNLPGEVTDGLPFLEKFFNTLKKRTHQISAESRNLNYRVKQLNNKQVYYDYMVQRLDSLIKKCKGYIKALEAEIETRTI